MSQDQPDGIHLEVLPPYSPELQPAERLWRLADEPLVNRCFDVLNDLEDVLAARCRTLMSMQSEIKVLTNYHLWPACQAQSLRGYAIRIWYKSQLG